METARSGKAFVVWSQAGPPEELQQDLSRAERVRLNAMRSDIARAEFATGAYLVRAIGATLTGLPLMGVKVTRPNLRNGLEIGRPSIAAADNWEVSVTHSAGKVGVAAAQHAALGLDIEQTPHRISWPVVKKICTNKEIKELQSAPLAYQPKMFAKYWTRKEAILKARKLSLSHPLKNIDVTKSTQKKKPAISTTEYSALRAEWITVKNPWEGHESSLALIGPCEFRGTIALADRIELLEVANAIIKLTEKGRTRN